METMKNKMWIIKFGGSLLSDEKARKGFLRQVVALATRRSLVLVHGGGPEITEALDKAGIKSQWVKGRRVTDKASMTIVEQVLSGQVNKALVGELLSLGAKAVGLSCRDGGLLRARAVPGLGRVGVPVKGRPEVLQVLAKAGFLSVVSTVAEDRRYQPLNVNGDEAAAALAVALKAERLLYLTDVAGVLDAQKKTIPLLLCRDIKALVARGVISGGMIPKVLSCRGAIQKGVGEVDIIDGRGGLKKMKGTRIQP
jgi:acetylglutamate kinase